MSGGRIRTCREALKLFIQSLPVGSKFSIIGFGSNIETMEIRGNVVNEYNDDTKNQALAKVDRFEADLGGTEILNPFKLAQMMEMPGSQYKEYNQWLGRLSSNQSTPMPEKSIHKRIFLLTDGQVGNAQAVVN